MLNAIVNVKKSRPSLPKKKTTNYSLVCLDYAPKTTNQPKPTTNLFAKYSKNSINVKSKQTKFLSQQNSS